MNKSTILALLFLLIQACAPSEESNKMTPVTTAEVSIEPPPPPKDREQLNRTTDTERKIIKEGEITFQTSDIKATRRFIYSETKKVDGYITEENESAYGPDNQKSYTIKLRVPAGKFDAFIDLISSNAGKIDSKNIRTQDVTTEYIDIKTRLDNQVMLESRYRALLNKASKMDDVLAIEGKLSEIRSEIESTQGQLNYLSKQVAYSTLTVTFYSSSVIDTGKSYLNKLGNAFVDGWSFLQNLIIWLLSVWPLLIILFLFGWLIRLWKKRRIKRSEK